MKLSPLLTVSIQALCSMGFSDFSGNGMGDIKRQNLFSGLWKYRGWHCILWDQLDNCVLQLTPLCRRTLMSKRGGGCWMNSSCGELLWREETMCLLNTGDWSWMNGWLVFRSSVFEEANANTQWCDSHIIALLLERRVLRNKSKGEREWIEGCWEKSQDQQQSKGQWMPQMLS